MNTSKRLNELRQHSRNSCITIKCVQAPLSCKVTSHTHTHRVISTTILFSPPKHACMCASIFRNRHAHTVVFFLSKVSGQHHVEDSVRWSLMLRSELCRMFLPSTRGGSRADLIVCTSKCTLQHPCAASVHIMRRRLISALIANKLISLAQIS